MKNNGNNLGDVSYPSNLDELKKLIKSAKEKGYKLTLVGAGMSQNFQNVGGHLVDLKRLNSIEIRPQSRQVFIRGNVTFSEMEQEANKFGLSTKVRQASGIFGILSSIATNVHGWDHKTGTLATTIKVIYALDSNAKEVVFRPGHDGFRDCVGSYGSTYLMYGAIIQLTDNVLMQKVVTTHHSLAQALLNFPQDSAEDIDMALITIGYGGVFYLVRFFVLSRDPKVSQNLQLEGPIGPYFQRLWIDISRLLTLLGTKKALDWLNERLFFVTGWIQNETKLRNEFMNVEVNAIKKPLQGIGSIKFEVWLVEYFVRNQVDLAGLVELFQEEYKDIFVFNSAIRFVKAYPEAYSTYAEEDMWALVISWDQRQDKKSLELSAARNKRFLEFLRPRHGKFYMAYRNEAKDIVNFYPQFAMRLYLETRDSVFSNRMLESVKAEQERRIDADDL